MDNSTLNDHAALSQLIDNAVGRQPDRAYCSGCHGRNAFHVMASEETNDPAHLHLSALVRDEGGLAVLEVARLQADRLGLEPQTHESNYLARGRTRHLVIKRPD